MPQPPDVAAIRDELLDLYSEAWTNVEARLARLVAENDTRTVVLRRRLVEISRDISATMDELDLAARGWIQQRLPLVYELGARAGADDIGERFSWAQHHRAAVQVLATDTYDDLLRATRFVRADTKRFVREAAHRAAAQSLIQGETAQRSGRSFAAQLRQVFGTDPIAAVRYANGARHGLADYADTVLRTKTAAAFNDGTLNTGTAAGITWVEIFDGPDCGWTSHDDPDKANGSVRPLEEAQRQALAHPRCARAFGLRPDIIDAAQAKAADRFTAEQRARMAEAERAAADARPRRFARERPADRRRRSARARRRARAVQTGRPPAPAPSTGLAGPTGPAVTLALDMQVTGQLAEGIEEGLNAIDLVHGDGTLPMARIERLRSRRQGLRGHFDPNAMAIRLTAQGATPAMTAVHEVGHFLDLHGIGAAGRFASSTARGATPDIAELADWWAAVDGSRALADLRALRTSRVPVDRGHVRYLMSAEELWARSYAQYVATRSGNQRMLGELARDLIRPTDPHPYYARQWDPDDFVPIADAMDRLFAAMGWRT